MGRQKKWNDAHPEVIKKAKQEYNKKHPRITWKPSDEIHAWLRSRVGVDGKTMTEVIEYNLHRIKTMEAIQSKSDEFKYAGWWLQNVPQEDKQAVVTLCVASFNEEVVAVETSIKGQIPVCESNKFFMLMEPDEQVEFAETFFTELTESHRVRIGDKSVWVFWCPTENRYFGMSLDSELCQKAVEALSNARFNAI